MKSAKSRIVKHTKTVWHSHGISSNGSVYKYSLKIERLHTPNGDSSVIQAKAKTISHQHNTVSACTCHQPPHCDYVFLVCFAKFDTFTDLHTDEIRIEHFICLLFSIFHKLHLWYTCTPTDQPTTSMFSLMLVWECCKTAECLPRISLSFFSLPSRELMDESQSSRFRLGARMRRFCWLCATAESLLLNKIYSNNPHSVRLQAMQSFQGSDFEFPNTFLDSFMPICNIRVKRRRLRDSRALITLASDAIRPNALGTNTCGTTLFKRQCHI